MHFLVIYYAHLCDLGVSAVDSEQGMQPLMPSGQIACVFQFAFSIIPPGDGQNTVILPEQQDTKGDAMLFMAIFSYSPEDRNLVIERGMGGVLKKHPEWR